MTSVTSQQDNWPAWLSNDLNKIESKVVWQISFKACRASVLQFVAVKSWQRSLKKKKKKKEARKRQWQTAMNRWDLATKKWEPEHHDVLYSRHFEKNASQIVPCWAFSSGSNTCPQGNRLCFVFVCCCCCRCFVFSLFSPTTRLSFLSLAYWPVRNRC